MIVRVRVIPNAKSDEVVGRIGSVIRVKVAAPAMDGRANDQLIAFLAEFFEVKPRTIHIMRGERAREKVIHISGRSEEELKDLMESIP